MHSGICVYIQCRLSALWLVALLQKIMIFFTRTDTSNTTYTAARSSDTLIAFVGHRIVSPDSVYICLILIETDTNKELLLIKRRQKLHTH